MPEYRYNEKTGKLHMYGCCHHANGNVPSYKIFATENDAIAYGKSALSWCQICVKKKEELLKKTGK